MGLLSDLYNGETNFDFPKWWRRALVLSAALVIVSIGSLVVRNLNLGIDFEGGTSWEVRTENPSIEDARDVMREFGEADAKIQVVDGELLRIQSAATDPDEVAEITDALREVGTVENFSSVGPSWGQEITEKAIRALVVFFLLLLFFMWWRLEFKMAVAALTAVVHDILISVGVYSLLQISVTPATVVSFLTILGYSLYDTIVVFDKVLENTARPAVAARSTYTQMLNTSLNAVLMRSLNTTIMGVLPVLAMLIVGQVLGAATLLEFAVALLVGLIVGAYSSIFVAAPILAWLKEREPRYRTQRERIERGLLPKDDVLAPATAVASAGGASVGDVRPTPATVSRPGPVGAIPPRPRKKKRR
jgi:preprotein translocase subunit SecF